MERFTEADFWIWIGVVFAVNAVAGALLGAVVLAAAAAVTAFLALLTASVLGRNTVGDS